MTGPHPVGARIALPAPQGAESAAGTRPDALLFGESTGRVVAATAEPERLLERARSHGVPAARIGSTGGARLVVGPVDRDAWIDEDVEALREPWSRALPRRLGEA